MKLFGWVAGVIFMIFTLLIALLYMSPIRADLLITVNEVRLISRIKLSFVWRLWRIERTFQSDDFLFNINKKGESSDDADGHPADSTKLDITTIRRLIPVVIQALKKIHLLSIRWVSRYGEADANRTALIYGMLWQLKTFVYWLLHLVLTLEDKNPAFDVQADWGKPGFTTEFSCIAEVRTGDAIIAGINVWRIMKK